ncbi:helix-turn-helix domain-containing protein [Streptomyces sp. NPDC021020]|uniref:helix-turn-helix domain-containing protein n=1 Tax=Streptomyces sp. NPDC021020 TaxID=3365109 RepID=UPI0037AAA6CC
MTRPAFIRSTPWQVQAGWLLRTHRTRHRDPALRGLAGFARAYREDRRLAGGVSPSSLSRWENGLVPVTAAAVRRYEDLVGLPPYSLLAPVQTIARHQGGPAAAAFLRGGRTAPETGPRMESLLDRALDNGMLTGGDWDALTRWTAGGGGRVFPSRVRDAVVQRLLLETTVADGVSWMRRFEALNRLVTDPLWGPATITVCAGAAQQPDHAGLIEAVCLLDASPHPDAGRAVLTQLTDPTTADTRYGALLAAARKVRKQHFTAEQTRTLMNAVEDLLAHPRTPHPQPDVEAAAVLLHRLPLQSGRAERLTASAADLGPTAHAIVAHGLLTDPVTAEVTVSRIMARLGDDTPGGPAGVLAAVVGELLHHPVTDVRLHAAMLLQASPHGPRIAAALAEELRQPATARAEDRAIPLLHALRVLGGPGQRAAVAGLTLAPGLPPGVSLAAVHALAHIRGTSPEGYWRAVFGKYTRDQDGAARHGDLKRLVCCFAMSGELDLLTRLVAEKRSRTAPTRHMSDWWAGLDRHVRDSALH